MKSMLAFLAALMLIAPSSTSAQSTVQLAPGRGEVTANAVPGLGTYSYDGSGNITAIGTQSFTYDAFGRLSTATVVPGRTQSFTYDRHGNLKEIKTTVGAVETKQPFGVDPATNQIDSPTGAANEVTAAYDAAGNVTHYDGGVYVYDSLNLLKTSSIGGIDRAYLYTASDERIAVVGINGGIERGADWTIRDPAGRVLRRFSKNPTDGAWRWSEDYIWRGSQLLAAEVPEQEKVRHFHLDHLGTPRIVTGNGGSQLATYEYDPFGLQIATPTASSGILDNPERLQFTGHERDTAKLDYMHARYYATGAGRFLSVDPAMDIKKNLPEPQRWNRYAYVTNNPLRYTDPDGRDRYQEPGFTKPYSEWGEALQMDENTPTVVKASNYAAGGLTVLGAAGFMGAGSALTAIGRGGMSLYRSFQVWNTLRTAAAGGVALSGGTNDMARQAIQMTVSLPGSPAQKAQLFQTLANQISRVSQGTWSAVRMAGAGGEHVFAGRDRVLVITKDGRIFTGAANALKAATKDAVAVDYEKLKLLR